MKAKPKTAKMTAKQAQMKKKGRPKKSQLNKIHSSKLNTPKTKIATTAKDKKSVTSTSKTKLIKRKYVKRGLYKKKSILRNNERPNMNENSMDEIESQSYVQSKAKGNTADQAKTTPKLLETRENYFDEKMRRIHQKKMIKRSIEIKNNKERKVLESSYVVWENWISLQGQQKLNITEERVLKNVFDDDYNADEIQSNPQSYAIQEENYDNTSRKNLKQSKRKVSVVSSRDQNDGAMQCEERNSIQGNKPGDQNGNANSNEKSVNTADQVMDGSERFLKDFERKVRILYNLTKAKAEQLSKKSFLRFEWALLLLLACDGKDKKALQYIVYDHSHQNCVSYQLQNTSQVFIGTDLKCKICRSEHERFYKNRCGHIFCAECWLVHSMEFYRVKSTMVNGDEQLENNEEKNNRRESAGNNKIQDKVFPSCIQCSQIMSPEIVLQLLNRNQVLEIRCKYWIGRALLWGDKKFVECHNINFHPSNQPQILLISSFASKYQCTSCLEVYCNKCHRENHFMASCDLVNRWEEHYENNQICLFKEDHYVCIQCEQKVEKIFCIENEACGCTQLYCRKCKSDWQEGHEDKWVCVKDRPGTMTPQNSDDEPRWPKMEIRLNIEVKQKYAETHFDFLDQRQYFALKNKLIEIERLNILEQVKKFLEKPIFTTEKPQILRQVETLYQVYRKGVKFLLYAVVVGFEVQDRASWNQGRKKNRIGQRGLQSLENYLKTGLFCWMKHLEILSSSKRSQSKEKDLIEVKDKFLREFQELEKSRNNVERILNLWDIHEKKRQQESESDDE